jgi:hypothetical protein
VDFIVGSDHGMTLDAQMSALRDELVTIYDDVVPCFSPAFMMPD